MGIYSADKCYIRHPDFPMECVGYDIELCCDCCGEVCDRSELYDVEDEMYCEDCIADGLDLYDLEKSSIYDDNGDLVDYCVYCGDSSTALYVIEGDVCCKSCACSEYYDRVKDRAINAALEVYLSRC